MSNENITGKKYYSERACRFSERENVVRKGIYTVEYTKSKIQNHMFDENKIKVDFDGDMVKANSQRYQTFFTKGCKCAMCGIVGKYFAKERCKNQKTYHLNLYAIDKNGKEVLMTKDHIIPKSKGGIDDISNYQTMCEECNFKKGNKLIY